MTGGAGKARLMPAASSSMTFRLPGDLQAAFVAACKADDRSAAQVLRGFMREYLKQRGCEVPGDDGAAS